MAIHASFEAMRQESLSEMINVARDCVYYKKDPKVWGNSGCYGYPAAILLFSIADTIGEYILSGSVRKHFDIFNHQKYYNLQLTKDSIDVLYKYYRSRLTHNAILGRKCFMHPGSPGDPVLEIEGDIFLLRLIPFYIVTKRATEKFLNDIRTSKKE